MKFPSGREWLLPCAAAALLGLLMVLATLQYRWTGQVSQAELERMHVALNADVARFSRDFDLELLRLSQSFGRVEASSDPDPSAERRQWEQLLSQNWDRWVGSSTHPRLVAGVYLVQPGKPVPGPGQQGDGSALLLSRFDPSSKQLASAEWPAELIPLRAPLLERLSAGPRDFFPRPEARDAAATRRALLEAAAEQALTFVFPLFSASFQTDSEGPGGRPVLSGYTLVQMDPHYLKGDFIRALTRQAFPADNAADDYDLAIVDQANPSQVVYTSNPAFPGPDASGAVDARIPLFRSRLEGRFGPPLREGARPAGPPGDSGRREWAGPPRREEGQGGPGGRPRREEFRRGPGAGRGGGWGERGLLGPGSPPGPPEGRRREPPPGPAGSGEGVAPESTRQVGESEDSQMGPLRRGPGPGLLTEGKWELQVRHKGGSLEAVVAAARRRNLAVSFGILLLLAGSTALIVGSAQRKQRLIRQQLNFVAGISHELRTPLAVICSAAENLADGVISSPEQIRSYGSLVRSEGRRLTGMVEQILEFAGIRSGKVAYEMRPVSVEEILGGAREACSAQIQEAGVRLEAEIEPSLPRVQADPSALVRALQNLFVNAIKYGGDARWIRLRAKAAEGAKGPEVQITVQDRGPGIATADLPHIFEPFYRGRQAVSAQIRGSGLGLNLVKNIVEAHGGSVTVASAPEQGSSFTIHLPALVRES